MHACMRMLLLAGVCTLQATAQTWTNVSESWGDWGWRRVTETRDAWGNLISSSVLERLTTPVQPNHGTFPSAQPIPQGHPSIDRALIDACLRQLAGGAPKGEVTASNPPPQTTAPVQGVSEAEFHQRTTELEASAGHAAVALEVVTKNGPPGMYQCKTGSGFIRNDGALVTARHVLLDGFGQWHPIQQNGCNFASDTLRITFAWQAGQPAVDIPLQAITLDTNSATRDLLILRPMNLSLLTYTKGLRVAARDPVVGERVIRMGSSGKAPYFYGGVVSAECLAGGERRLQTSQLCRQGDSGAPVLSWEGEVCAIHTGWIGDFAGHQSSTISPLP